MDIQGGEEVAALVIDVGHANTRAGFAGDDAPATLIPSYVGIMVGEESNAMEIGDDDVAPSAASARASTVRYQYFVDLDIQFPRERTMLESPFENVSNFEHVTKILRHAYTKLSSPPEEHPLIMSEVPYVQNPVREKLTEILFETFRHPAVFFSKSAVLASFASAKATALVVESGAGISCAAPVVDGYVLKRAVVCNNYAGDWLTGEIRKHYDPAHRFRPAWMFEKKKVQGGLQLVARSIENYHQSFIKWTVDDVVDDLKRDVFCISANAILPQHTLNVPGSTFDLPDRTVLHVGPERLSIPERFFQPTGLTGSAPDSQIAPTVAGRPYFFDRIGLHDLAVESIRRLDLDVRKTMFTNVVLAGGNTALNGLDKRFEREITAKTPMAVRTPRSPILGTLSAEDRKHAAWIGGSITASLGSFQQMWMSREQFQDQGPTLVHRSCP